MQKWKIIAGLLLVFVLGTLTGALGTGMVLKRQHPFFSRQPEDRKALIMKRLSRKLDLSAKQKVRIETIIDRVQAEAFQKMREGRRFIREHLEKGFAEIRQELTPDQQRRFDQMKAERERRRKERGERLRGPWRPEDDL